LSELHIELARAREQIGAWMQPTLVRLGCRDTDIQLIYLLALLDGLLLARLTQPPPHPPSNVAIAGLLHGLIG
jgi:Tetracyclin repressor-like, C-terminal domain